MKIVKALRYTEWWEYKLPPLLSIGYATLLLNKQSLFSNLGTLFFIMLSLVIGAIYVSIINDITDIKDDISAGKENRMAGFSSSVQFLLPTICLLLGAAFLIFFYWPDYLSCIFYLIPWLSFTMYSFKPIRLKNRGVWGVIADASGAHIFTSLLMVSYTYFSIKQPVNMVWMLLIAIWAACFGIRGILWHQFHDRENDIRSGIETFATKRKPHRFYKTEIIIFCAEVFAVLGILLLLNNMLTYLSFVLYMVLFIIRHKKLQLSPVIIIERKYPYQILLLDFGQVFFPLSLLLYAALTQPAGWIVLIIHVVLFPFKTLQVLKDIKRAFQKQPD